MSNLSFTEEIALKLYNSEDAFPVDFDDAWVWFDRPIKETILSSLDNDFEEDLDYVFKQKPHPLLKIMSPNMPDDLIVQTAIRASSYVEEREQKIGTIPEKVYSDALSAFLSGNREVKCSLGRIDVLASDWVIEVKHIKQWKRAIQQVNSYSADFPDKQKIIFLLDTVPVSDYSTIDRIATRNNVSIWLLSEIQEQITPYLEEVAKKEKANKRNGLVIEKLYLTVDCFSLLGKMIGTEKGKLINRYFLDCKKIIKESTESLMTPTQMLIANAIQLNQQSIDLHPKENAQSYSTTDKMKKWQIVLKAIADSMLVSDELDLLLDENQFSYLCVAHEQTIAAIHSIDFILQTLEHHNKDKKNEG